MDAEQPSAGELAAQIAQHGGLTLRASLGGRANEHWVVGEGERRCVLRAYAPAVWDDIPYELTVLRRLRGMGWPVAEAVAEPLQHGGRTWCLFRWLPGACRPQGAAAEERARGRLLAELHAVTAQLEDLGQRRGFQSAAGMVRDPALAVALRGYERLRPAEGHVLRWHLERTQEAFAALEPPGRDAEAGGTLVVHGDFTPWNLLFEGARLTGILDFELTHQDYRVADFALAWRGAHDAVIAGYEEVRPLAERDWALLVPVYWAWLFLHVAREATAMLEGRAPAHGFAWQVTHLLRRDGLAGRLAPSYPG